VNAYEVNAGISVIAHKTVSSMPEHLECEVLQQIHLPLLLPIRFILPKINNKH